MTDGTGDAAGRRFTVVLASLLVLLLAALRIALAYVREPFFDELFTVWISRKSFAAILESLKLDSGPPAFYFVVHSLSNLFGPSVALARAVSISCGIAAMALVMSARWLGEARWAAAAFLAVLPAHFYYSSEGRSYAACALLVGVGVLALDRWSLPLAVVSIILAAYTHYYGVLFFPLPLVAGVLRAKSGNERRSIAGGAIASAACAIAFIPGFFLAAMQPVREATAWAGDRTIVQIALSPARLAFAGPFPASIVTPPPVWLQIVVCATIAGLLLSKTVGSPRATLFAAATLTPIILAIAGWSAGRDFYFPLRFESVLAVPFALWLAVALDATRRGVRSVLFAFFVVVGFTVSAAMIVGNASRATGSYRAAARWVRANVTQSAPIVASGYAYLEIASRTDESWSPAIRSLPAEQAQHPGWVARPTEPEVAREVTSISESFVWIGEVGSPQFRVVRARGAQPLFREDRAGVLLVPATVGGR